MKLVELYGRVRYAVRIEGISRREAARGFGIDPRTVAKMLAFSVPPGYRRSHPPMRPKLDGFVGIFDRILEADKGRPAKQRHTSSDNPLFESHFKTLKYQPRLPKRFGCIEDARSFCRAFFDWYNQDHHHAGIGLMIPDQVYYGQIDAVHAARQATRDQAFQENPQRFVKNRRYHPPNQPPHGSTRRR